MPALAPNLADLVIRAATEFKRIRTLLNGNAADLSGLNTATKTNLVAAINEVQGAIAGASGIDDGVTSTTSSWSSAKTAGEIDGRVSALVDTAPGALDTLNELAAALGDDPNFAGTIAGQIGGKANDADVVHRAGAETITGTKTFSTAPVVPDGSFSTAAVTGLPGALDGKASTGHTHDASGIVSGVLLAARLPGATDGAAGIVELATADEALAGTDTTRAVTPAGVAAVAATRAAVEHGHTIAGISGLQGALDAKANAADIGDPNTDFVAIFEAALA